MSTRAFVCLLLASLCAQGYCKDLKVPQQFPTIQSAIDAASKGDRVLIASGIYKGSGNVNLDFEGKAITVQGDGYLSTIIDGESRSRGFVFHSGESASSVLRSLTIKNCAADYGAAICANSSSPLILSCNIEDCSAATGGAAYLSSSSICFQSVTFLRNHSTGSGGAIYADGSSPLLVSCTFDFNTSRGYGAAFAGHGGKASITSCTFKDGEASFGGGAVALSDGAADAVNSTFSQNSSLQNAGAIDLSGASALSVANCTLAANLSHRDAGGVRVGGASTCKIWNSILWSDVPSEIGGRATVGYTCISGGHQGTGNTDDDPKLVDGVGQDLHLVVGSPCIDKGDASGLTTKDDHDGRDRTIGSAPDMGAFEYPITRPDPIATAPKNATFIVPHDGNPNTDIAQVQLKASGYDQLSGALSFLWMVDNEVVGTSANLSMPMEPGKKQFDFEVRDTSGNVAKSSVYVLVLPEPNQAPTADAGSDVTVKAAGATARVVLHGHGFDADGDPLTYLWSTGGTSQDLCVDLAPGNHSFTFTVTDPYGAHASATVRVHVLDTGLPIVTLNGATPMSLEVFTAWIDPGATAHDDIDGNNLNVTVSGTVNNKKLGSYDLVYSATDSSGNTGSATRTVVVKDTTAPVITLKGDNPLTVDCSKGYSEPGATAADNYDGSIPVSISGSVLSSAGTYTVTYTATDSSGNSATATRMVIVKGVSAPVITLNGSNPMAVECGAGYTEPGASAKDGCSGASLPVTISGTVASAAGTYTLTYSATDSNGNSISATRTVVVSDSIAPVITLNGANPMTVECGTGYSEPGATASDACDDAGVPVSISGSVPSAKGSYTMTYTATDKKGNKATVTRTVIVSDTKAPVITLNGSNPMNVECGTGYVEPGATASDGCDGASIGVTISGTVPSPKGTYTVTYTAIDGAGNKTTATRTVKVVDTTPPSISLVGFASTTVECGSGYTELGALAIDTCDGAVAVTISGSVSSAKGTYTVTYKATDSSGNVATKTRTVIVQDTTPPVITLAGSNPMSISCGNGYVESGASANDSCDGVVAVTISGTVLSAKGTYTVTYTAKDSSGNTSTASRTVNVVDTIAPVITLKGSNPMTVDLANGVYSEPGATAADACDGSVSVSTSGPVLAVIGTYTVTYTATDGSGNKSTTTRTVNVISTAGPTITGLTASPGALNSQNQNMKAIALTYVVTDPADPSPTIKVTATSSDADSGVFVGDLPGDIVVNSATSVDLRQEHAPGKTRTYTITVKVTDKTGKTTTASVNVVCQ